MLISEDRNKKFLWMTLTLLILMIILFFGLRPKGLRLKDAVHLDLEGGEIDFHRNGIAYAGDLSSVLRSEKGDAFTIEMAVRAGSVARRQGFGDLLMIHDGSDNRQLIIGQWESSIIIMNGDDYDHTRRRPRLSSDRVFSTRKIRFITITAGDGQTRLYIDGKLSGQASHWQLKIPRKGSKVRLVLGNSVTGKGSWIGAIYGLAIYGWPFPAEKVQKHYRRWSKSGRFPEDEINESLLFYTFKKRQGNKIPDLSGHNDPLQIPSRPIVLNKTFLAPPWHDLKLNRSTLIDVTLNLLGFIPLGFVLSGWLGTLSWRRFKRKSVWIVGFCFLLSLSMEILQAWVPTRDSSMRDLILNTLGAWLGVWLFESAIRFKNLPWIRAAQKNRNLRP